MKLEIKNGCFAYEKGRPILEHINFSIGESQIMTVIGANGIGKTTLLKCTLGILKWDIGETRINGKTARNIQDYREVAYVPQAHRLSFPYTVKEMVLMGRNKRIGGLGSPSRQDDEKCERALEMAGIGDLGNKICSKLSGGQLQLVFIARALAAEPELLILDEPESHLDLRNQFRILRLLKRMTAEKGISCIVNTHYPDHALRISDTTLMLNSHEYIFGKSRRVITETTVRRYFHVDIQVLHTAIDGYSFDTMIVAEKL